MYRLLIEFEALFKGKQFLHRRPNQGDWLAAQLYEDLVMLGRSTSLLKGVETHRLAINSGNKIVGMAARRGDGTFGELVPNVAAIVIPGFAVARGPVATLEIGAETKIFSTALGKQQRERVGDINDQAATFRKHNVDAITVAIIGMNHAEPYSAYEGERVTKTDGKKYKHPAQEAPAFVTLLTQEVKPNFDEFILLPYRATNEDPFPFEWLNQARTHEEYGASLLRVSNLYEKRFGR